MTTQTDKLRHAKQLRDRANDLERMLKQYADRQVTATQRISRVDEIAGLRNGAAALEAAALELGPVAWGGCFGPLEVLIELRPDGTRWTVSERRRGHPELAAEGFSADRDSAVLDVAEVVRGHLSGERSLPPRQS